MVEIADFALAAVIQEPTVARTMQRRVWDKIRTSKLVISHDNLRLSIEGACVLVPATAITSEDGRATVLNLLANSLECIRANK